VTRLIALSAAYGAGGSIIGPALAERLGVPFLDRAIPLAVADRLEVSYDDALSADRRARQAAAAQNLSGEAADRACAQFDRTHEAYFRQFYGVQIQDPALYHVVLDSTAIDLDACVEIIARAAECLIPGSADGAAS
jgi:hypothetical protein